MARASIHPTKPAHSDNPAPQSQLTRRRAILGAGAALATATAAAVVPAVAQAATALDADLVALERKRSKLYLDAESVDRAHEEAMRRAPDWAKPDHAPYPHCQWPAHDPESFLITSMGGLCAVLHRRRPSLEAVRQFNRQTEALGATIPDEHAKRRAEGRQRVRAWIARRREQRAAMEEANVLRQRRDDITAQVADIEDAILRTEAQSYVGLAVKLRLAIYLNTLRRPEEISKSDAEEMEYEEDMILRALWDCERLAGAGVAA